MDAGDYCEFFPVGNSHVVKVYYTPFTEQEFLQHECKIHSELYKEGISVPKPEGIFPVKIRPLRISSVFRLINREGLLMEKISGLNWNNITGKDRLHVHQLFEEEVKKCWRLGFRVGDSNLNNTIYNKSTNRLYLIDFQFWSRQ
jgi:RIO-like serine/threonine protein kinase